MGKPDHSGEILRAIARSYRDEVGPARAEQLVIRAMARAGQPSPRFNRFGVLAASVGMAASVLAVGVIVLVGNSESSESDPVSPVASDQPSVVSTPEAETPAAPILPTEELEEALDLLEQQRQMEAAEVVVRALSSIVVTVVDSGDPAVVPSSTPTTAPEQQGTRPNPSTVAGQVPPEQSTYRLETGSESSVGTESTETGTPSQQSDSPTTASDPEPTIEELGQALRVEVEELLSADPQDLAEAAEEAREAAQQIQDHGGEPTILLPPDGDDEE